MSTSDLVEPSRTQPQPRPLRPRAFAAELLKIRSLASLYTLAFSTVLCSALIAGLVSHAHRNTQGGDGQSVLDVPLNALGLSGLLVTIFGVMCATGDYTTGMLRTSLIAHPQRARLYLAKLAACAAAVFAVAVTTVLGCLLVAAAVLHGSSDQITSSTPGLGRAFLGAVYYLLGWGVAGLGLGTVSRRTAPGIGAGMILMWILPGILSLWDFTLALYVAPTNTGMEMFSSNTLDRTGYPSLPVAVLSFSCFLVLCVLAGWQRFREDT